MTTKDATAKLGEHQDKVGQSIYMVHLGFDNKAQVVSAKIVKVTAKSLVFEEANQATNYSRMMSFYVDKETGTLRRRPGCPFYFSAEDAVTAYVERCRAALAGAQADMVDALAMAEAIQPS